ncbi:hypothetical protein [Rhizobium sp. RU35A]|uniref:hypothetical protein n=1 Tax=Rhizobium sp. RU35A TaxID=1907414 RepID=UPI00122CB78F|nr:hypothetical protein [Rhizobium sp. RU35A]
MAEVATFADASNLEDISKAAHALMLCLAEAAVKQSLLDKPIDRAAPGDAFYKLYPARQEVEIGTNAAGMVAAPVPAPGIALTPGRQLVCGDITRGPGRPTGSTYKLSPRLTVDLEAFARMPDAEANETLQLLGAVRGPSAPAPLTDRAKVRDLVLQRFLDQDPAITGTVEGIGKGLPPARGLDAATASAVAAAMEAAKPEAGAAAGLAADCCCKPTVPTLVRGIGGATASPKLEVPVDWLMGGVPQNVRK